MSNSECCCYCICPNKPRYKSECIKRKEPVCIQIDYCGFITDGPPVDGAKEGLYLDLGLDQSTCILYRFEIKDPARCPDAILDDINIGKATSVIPTKKNTKFLDCNTKNLYKLTLGINDSIECILIKKICSSDCIKLLCTPTRKNILDIITNV